MKENTITTDHPVFLCDMLTTVAVFLFSFWWRESYLPSALPFNFYSHLFVLPLLMFFMAFSLSYFAGYRRPYDTPLASYAWSIFRAIVIAVGALLALLFFLKIEYVSRLVILLFASMEFFALLLIRLVSISYYKKQVVSGKNALRVLIVGSRGRAKELYAALRDQVVWGVKVVGFVDPDPAQVGARVMGIPIIGTVANIHECLKNNVIDEVIIAIPRSLLKDAEPIVVACEAEGIRLRFMADIFEVQVARVSLSEVKGIPLLNMEPVARDPQQLMAKRVFDVICTLVLLPLLSPIFLVVAILIKLESPGPAFFVQPRVGMRKHVFPMIKFRSMYQDAEARFKEIEHLNEAKGPIFKMRNDPRITRVGRFIRKTSIDELPQLLNVLRGQMSLVGPRPMSLRDVELFDKGIQRKRFSVQPGLTCIWQISGRSNLPFEKWLELDLKYIENWNFWLDIGILFKTIPAVVRSHGAL